MRIKVCFTDPFAPLEEPCQLVVFKNGNAAVPSDLSELFLTSCQKYAQKYQVYLATTLFEREQYLCMALFSPEGELLGVQRATHLNLSMAGECLPYDHVDVISTPIGRIFLSVDVDIYHPEVLRLAVFQECDFVISSQLFPMRDFSDDRIFFGVRSAAVANRVFILHTTPFSSSLLCPPELTGDGSGFLLYPSAREQTAEFDWEDASILRQALMDDLLGSNCLQHYYSKP